MAIEISAGKLRHYWPVYMLVALPLALVLVFDYFLLFLVILILAFFNNRLVRTRK